MVRQYYDRYSNFKINNDFKCLPLIKVIKQSTDILIQYKSNRTRLDIVSNTYYGVPYYGWLIMLANPQYGGLEFDIPEGAELRVPYPLFNALRAYEKAIETYDVLYKIDS